MDGRPSYIFAAMLSDEESGGTMLIPFLVFWIVLYLARDDFGFKGIAVAIAVWLGMLAGILLTGISPFYFAAAVAILDIALILRVFGEDIPVG